MNPESIENNARLFLEAYNQPTLLLCLFHDESEVQAITTHPDVEVGLPERVNTATLIHGLMVEGKRPHLLFEFSNEIHLEDFLLVLDQHFRWTTEHKTYLKPVFWMHESAFLTLQGIMEERTRQKIHMLIIPSAQADRADRLMSDAGRDGIRWELVRKLREPLMVAHQKQQLQKEQQPKRQLFLLQHLSRLLRDVDQREHLKVQIQLMDLHLNLLKQGQKAFLKPLIDQLFQLEGSGEELFQLDPEAAEVALWKMLNVHQEFVTLGISRSPVRIWMSGITGLTRILGSRSAKPHLKHLKPLLQEVMSRSLETSTLTDEMLPSLLKRLIQFFWVFAEVLTEDELLDRGEWLLEQLETSTPDNLKESSKQLLAVILRQLIHLNSDRQQDYGKRLLALIGQSKRCNPLYEELKAWNIPIQESWTKDPHFEVTLLTEAIGLYERGGACARDLALLYMERGSKQTDEDTRVQDLRKALHLYQETANIKPLAKVPSSDEGLLTETSLEVAQVHRLLKERREALEVVNRGIQFWWVMAQGPQSRPDPLGHRQEQLSLRLAERIRILEELLPTDPPDASTLQALLQDTHLTLEHLKTTDLSTMVWETNKKRLALQNEKN